MTEPHAITGMAVDREKADLLLEAQPPGVFLLRMSAEAGALSLSVKKRGGRLEWGGRGGEIGVGG